MSHKNFRDARSFLDLEAQVERDEDEEEDMDEPNDFIDDTELGDIADIGPEDSNLRVWMRQWFGEDSGPGNDEEEEPSDESVFRKPFPHDDEGFPDETRHRTTREEALERLASDFPLGTSLQSITTPADYPLWRVPCREGLEQEAVFCLLNLAARPRYELRSAFTRGSIRGYVYLEATMNRSLVSLLKQIPGIRHGTNGLQYLGIPQEDWEALLIMRDSTATPVVGEWVLISRGTYKGDLALVTSFEDWQGVRVLMIPRIPCGNDLPSSSKRKRSTCRPPPRLFDPNAIPKDASVQPMKLMDDVYNYGSLRLEHGLIRQSFDLHSVSQGVLHMSNEVFTTFHESRHPEILAAQYPCPLEFKFEEKELVLVLPTHKPGRITALRPCDAEIALLNGEGDVSVSWANIQKHVVLGDYVEILSGTDSGHKGFVTAAQGNTIAVSELEPGNVPNYHLTRKVKEVVVHVNWVKLTTAPYSHHLESFELPSTARPQVDEVTMKFRTPWLHKFVIVTKSGHPMKGLHAKVVDAIRPESPRSKPSLVVQYEHISPTGPRRERLPYDHVVDAVSGKQLYAVFSREHPFYFETCELKTGVPRLRGQSPTPNVGSTPAWSPPPADESLSPLSPAWNPSARTPCVPLSLSPAWNPSPLPLLPVASGSETPSTSASSNPQRASASVPTTPRSPPTHPLLDPRLVGKMLRVTVTGGAHPKKKETPVSIVWGQNNGVVIQQKWRNELVGLLPEWVSPRFPNPTRDNGLLVVIRGDHCGKYVRRIHHSYVNGDRNRPVMQLAVIERINGVEALTEERVDLPPEELCQSVETEGEKNINAQLMTSLRERAR